jgi:exonuclease SbcD
MRILHTADWHLGDRLGRIDRTDDLRRGVERVARYCAEEKVELLLVAGDLFSELAGPDGLREAVRHLRQVFEDFLGRGGTILTLTGNHDKETFCQTLRHAMSLASPLDDRPGVLVQPGRLYLATAPTLLRLEDRAAGRPVQFVLMPYPTPTRYLTDETTQRYAGLEEKNRHLMTAFTRRLHDLQTGPGFDAELATVLAAHVHVRGSTLHSTFRMTEQEDVVFDDADLPLAFAYIALGHIHKPQALNGHAHVRYPGSIERLDLGEARDDKGVLLLEVGPEGLRGEPYTLPLDATPIYEVSIRSPKTELDELAARYPDHERALVRVECTYTAGVDNREETLRKLEEVFPRWYDRQLTEANALGPTLTVGEAPRARSVEETVRDYLRQELTNHPEPLREAVLARAEALLKEVQA